jgi:hypothetical protein
MKAKFIMAKDPGAKAAYDAMKARGMSGKDAAAQIEIAFDQCFLV